MADNKPEQLDNDPLAHLDSEWCDTLARHAAVSACYNVDSNVQICYTQKGTSFDICVKVVGVNIGCATINSTKPCAEISGNAGLAKASVEVCIKGTCLTYSAKVCYRETPWSSWKCASSSGTMVCF